MVTDDEEVKVLKRLHKFNQTLPEIGVKMKTGLTVDFRNRDILRDEEEEGAIPLFYSQHIKQGKVQFPIQKEHEYVVTDQRGLMQDNKNCKKIYGKGRTTKITMWNLFGEELSTVYEN